MRVSIDTTALSSAHQYRGIGWYTKHLLDAIQRYESDIDVVSFSQGDSVPESDLVHIPYFDPFFLTLPKVGKRKSVVTIHDLIPLVFPTHFPKGLKGRVAWEIQKRRVRRIDAVLTDSEASKKDITRFIGLAEDRIHVVYLAASDDFRRVDDLGKLRECKKRYELDDDTILYVGDINYNKNVPALIEAFSLILRAFPSFTLVLVGDAFLGSALEAKVIDDLIVKHGISDNVKRLGFVPSIDLPLLYNLANIYVQPSLYEGFCLPVLEAMACGCPVVVTQGGSLPEIAGSGTVMVEANDADSIAKRIVKVLTLSKKDRQNLINKGFTQAAKFSWQKTARDTVSVYQRLFNKR